jgi:hypothetical protein
MEDIKMKRNPIFLSVIFLSALPVPFCGFAALGPSRLCVLMGFPSTAWMRLSNCAVTDRLSGSDEEERRRTTVEILDEVLRETPSRISAARLLEDSRR